MKTRLLIVTGLSVLCLMGTPTGQIQVRLPAPTDRAADFPLAELQAIVRQMDADGVSTVRLLEGGTYNINVRRLRGAETALVHDKTTDVYVIREGSGTLVTGGTIVDDQGQPAAGRGVAIRGGNSRQIGVGDVVFIPAGVPHGIRDSDGITFLNIRFDTK